jgi:hypothetical protein
MTKRSGARYPNGKSKAWLLEIALSARDFGCSLEDYAFDLALARVAEVQGTDICRWTEEASGRCFIDGLALHRSDQRLEIIETGFRFVPVANRIFISYAKEDKKHAERLYCELTAAGACPWMDTKNLKPGQRWQAEIEGEIENCTHFIALLSSRSVSKRGYVQSEIRRALEVWDRLPDRTLFLMPVRLDECSPSHRSLDAFHRVDLFPRWKAGLEQILASLDIK